MYNFIFFYNLAPSKLTLQPSKLMTSIANISAIPDNTLIKINHNKIILYLHKNKNLNQFKKKQSLILAKIYINID